jgi:magnesium transporter
MPLDNRKLHIFFFFIKKKMENLQQIIDTINNEKAWTIRKCKIIFQLLNSYQLQYYEVNQKENPDVNYYLSFIENEYRLLNNTQGYVLTFVATIFLPLSFIVGFFGMNFRSMTNSIYKINYGQMFVLSICTVVVIGVGCILLFGLRLF